MVLRTRWRAAALGVAIAAGTVATTGTASGEQASTIGSDGYVHVAPNGVVLGVDSYYPKDGNGGYDVADYQVLLDYAPSTNYLSAVATIRATTTQELSRFNLDLRGLTVRSVKVNGAAAQFSRTGEHELVITPATTLAANAEFAVTVAYQGTPTAYSSSRGPVGWQRSWAGGAFASGAPHSARTWFPVNDTSVDTATVTVRTTVPNGWTVVGNGSRSVAAARPGYTTTTWTEARPVSPSGTVLGVGKYTVTETPGVVPAVHAVGSSNGRALADALPSVMTFLTGLLGDYPQKSAGGLYLADALGYTHPAQGRPVYGACATVADVVYATAAQWWTNQVGIKMWKDAPLVESFAKYAVWLWDASKGADLDARYDQAVRAARPEFWARKLSDPGKGREFSVADKGVLMVHALRKTIGDDAFFAMYQGFPAINDGWPQGWYDWELYTEAVADMDLHEFFATWVDGTAAPGTR